VEQVQDRVNLLILLNHHNPNLPLVILQCLHFREDKLLDRVRGHFHHHQFNVKKQVLN
jgi:hypothetical protein